MINRDMEGCWCKFCSAWREYSGERKAKAKGYGSFGYCRRWDIDTLGTEWCEGGDSEKKDD